MSSFRKKTWFALFLLTVGYLPMTNEATAQRYVHCAECNQYLGGSFDVFDPSGGIAWITWSYCVNVDYYMCTCTAGAGSAYFTFHIMGEPFESGYASPQDAGCSICPCGGLV